MHAREKLLFDFGWKFHRGDLPCEFPIAKMPTYHHAKTERAMGAAVHEYDDSEWEAVTLPHDYVILQRPQPVYNQALGYFKYENAWYRNSFTLPNADRDKRLTLLFDGVATHCTVWVNGCLMHRHFNGYTPFEIDITDVAHFGGERNTVAVYVDTTDHEGWWYEGGGIYRHVWLVKTARVSVDLYGVWVHPERQADGHWQAPVETTLRNDEDADAAVAVTTTILDGCGKAVACDTAPAVAPYRDATVVQQCLTVSQPALWDTDHPNFYWAVTQIARDGEVIDEVRTRFGFRTLRFDAQKGFFLNDQPVKIKGVCCHQDYGLSGKAMPDRVHHYRLRRLREMGANGYRCSHYPPSETTLEACDELGFLVMDEDRWFESTPEGMAALETMVRRDRNHPSIIFWSVGNEEPLQALPQGRRILQSRRALVHRLDPTRPVTLALNAGLLDGQAIEASDVIGINYQLELYDTVHERYPDVPIVSSECCAVATTRGWYGDDSEERGYYSAFDHTTNDFGAARETTWSMLDSRDYVCGGYQWAGIEHRGETVWPRLCSQSGALDLFLQPKDAYYQNQSHWSATPMVHLLPHWNLAGREGETVTVWAYTNGAAVELLQDGKSLGTQYPGPYGHGVWQVTYQPGQLKALAYDVAGNMVAQDVIETTGQPERLVLRLEDPDVRADGEDVAILTCYCEDSKGRMVPTAAPMLHFNCNHLGRIAGTGSDVADHEPVPCLDRKMRAGLCSVLVKVGDVAGRLVVRAEAEGLLPAKLELELTPAPRRPYVKGVETNS